MADHPAGLRHVLDSLLLHFGVHGDYTLEAGLYIVVAVIFLWLCLAVPSVIRAALPPSSMRH